MSKVSKDEVMKALGQAQVQGMKEAVKEQAKEMGLLSGMMPGRANPVVTGAFEQVAQQATAVRLNIQRRDPVSGKMTYIRGPGEIDANLIASKGLPEIIDDWCGGGEYTVEVMAPGQERLMQNFTVGGAPQDPGYRAKTAVAGGVPVNQAYDPSHYFGVPRPMYAAQDNSSNMAVKMMEIMMAKEMMSAKLGSVANAGQSSSEVQELRAELARMRDDQKRSEEDRRRNEEMDRIRREAAEDRRKSEERFEKLLAEMNKDKTPAWMGLAQAALPAVAEVFKGKDATMGLLSNTFGTVLQAQQMAANQQAETFKMLMNRPTAADEISKMTGVFAQSQLTNLQTINQIVSSGLLDKGGGHPLVELLSQLIDQGGQVLQAGLSNKGGNGAIAGLEQEPAAPPLHIASNEPPQLTAPKDKDTQKQYDLNADPSFRVIIEQIKGIGDPREIALRLYRHGQPLREDQGHPLAKQWCRDPAAYSKLILGQLGVSAQRIEQITTALIDLALWVKDNRDPEEFATVETRRRRRKRLIPSASPEMQATHGFSFVDPGDGEEVDDEEFDDAEDGEISDDESQQSMELIAEEAQATEASLVAES